MATRLANGAPEQRHVLTYLAPHHVRAVASQGTVGRARQPALAVGAGFLVLVADNEFAERERSPTASPDTLPDRGVFVHPLDCGL